MSTSHSTRTGAGLSLVVATVLSGCAGNKPAAQSGADVRPAANVPTAPADAPKQLVVQPGNGSSGASIPRPAQQVLQLAVYQITVPRGAITQSDEFWKRVDEHSVDAATYDLLLRNGMRVGLAPAGEWEPYFKAIVEHYPATTQASTATGFGSSGVMELSLKKGIDFQNLFYLAPGGGLRGRTYEDCEDLLAVSFQPTPRRTDRARVKVCPVVRGMRKRYEVANRGEEREVRYVHPEQLYDLNLEADVPTGSFLVVAPSNQALWPMNLGNTFLLQDGPAEQFELVLLLVPRLIPVEEAPTDPPPLLPPDPKSAARQRRS